MRFVVATIPDRESRRRSRGRQAAEANHATIYALWPPSSAAASSPHLIILFKKVLTPRRACRFTVRLGDWDLFSVFCLFFWKREWKS